MDNGKWLEMMGFHTNRLLAKVQKHRCRNKPNSRRMVVQLWPWVTFVHTHHSQHVYSNYPQLSCFTRSRQGVTGVHCIGNVWKCLGTNINDRMRKTTKKTLCSACMCHGLIWTFCMYEEVCLLLCTEGSLFLLP